MKRYRAPKIKPGELKIYYGRVDGDAPDVVFGWGGSGANKRDAALLQYYIGGERLDHKGGVEPRLIDELKRRGYDLSTLKFSIQRLPSSEFHRE